MRKCKSPKNDHFTLKTNNYNKMNENARKWKNIKKTDKNTIFDNITVEISSKRPSNYPKCVLWPRCQSGFDFI